MADQADVQVPAPDPASDPILADFLEEQGSSKAESSTAKPEAKAEDKPEVAKDTKEEVKADDTATPPDVPTKGEEGEPAEADKAEVDEAVTPEDKPQGKAETRKDQLNGEIRDLVAQRNTLKEQVEKANAEVYQPATEKELTDEGMTGLEAKVEAMRQEREMEKYNSQVADAQLTIGRESERVLQDFPIFNSDSPDFDKELFEEAAQLLQANLILDPNTNQIIGSNVSPYQLYKTLARASGISTVKGQIKGQEATEKQMASVDAGGAASPPTKPKDPLMSLFLEED